MRATPDRVVIEVSGRHVVSRTIDQVIRETRIVAPARISKAWARGLAVKLPARPRR